MQIIGVIDVSLGEVKLLIKELESSFLSLGQLKFLQLDVIFYSSC